MAISHRFPEKIRQYVQGQLIQNNAPILFPYTIIELTRLCLEQTQYTVKIDYTVSLPFSVDTGLKQEGVFFPITFNIVLEKVI